jgi:E3 ubiquitin-protein ligase HUWE1
LYHWIDVLNRFDEILEKAWKLTGSEEDECVNLCVGVTDEKTKELVVSVLKFSALLIEHSYARHVYNSMESLVTLLGSTDMDIIIAVLNLLYVFSKRSNFLVRLSSDQRHSLQLRLNHLAESWGGKENGFGLAQCCTDKPITVSDYCTLMLCNTVHMCINTVMRVVLGKEL